VSRTAEERRLHDRRWWTLGVLCLSLLIVFVGNSSLNVTIPTLSRELHATTSQLQWVVAAYSLVFAGALRAADRSRALGSLAGALQTAGRLPQAAATRLILGAERAFVSGIHFAAFTGALLATTAAFIVYRFLPHDIAQHGAVHGPVEALEEVAELAFAGVPPVFADTPEAAGGPPEPERANS